MSSELFIDTWENNLVNNKTLNRIPESQRRMKLNELHLKSIFEEEQQ